MKNKITAVVFFLFLFVATYAETPYVHHDISVTIEPVKNFIRVTDTIRLPSYPERKRIHFLLHGNLKIVSHSGGVMLKKESEELKSEYFGINTAQFEIKKKIPVNHFSVRFLEQSAKTDSFYLIYEGTVNHPIEQAGGEYARGFSETPGIICEQGVYLAGTTFWVPWFNEDPVTFKIDARLPENWIPVSEGTRKIRLEIGHSLSTWDSPEPMEEIHLIAARFKAYGLKAGKVELMAFLRSEDKSLADRYLETTGQYLDMYEKLIGPYPFSKFALIENFWETGYGMSSFTLLGPKVIRFPFILHSSYPHELLHNWWGNSVFVDYRTGNWCEGLTVYLADHLIKEQRGQGEEYRKTVLQEYTHYASGQTEEFPLAAFKARYSSLSSSIGYGKSMMVFHMLRRWVGDKAFKEAIRHFYKLNIYRKASFDDIRKSFQSVTGKNFREYFKQWVTRSGVPEIRLADASVKKQGSRYRLDFSLLQDQREEPYILQVPVAIVLEKQPESLIRNLEIRKRRHNFSFWFDDRPLELNADPQFDVMRKLHEHEIPATLSNAFGAKSVLILLPSGAPGNYLNGYRALAENWSKDNTGQLEIKMDAEVEALPADRAVWLFGRENLHNPAIKNGISGYPAEFREGSMVINRQNIPFDNASIVIAVKNSLNPSRTVILLSTDRVEALPGLGRKLPHYGKYSYLAFEGDEPVNTVKGQWPVVNSPMSVVIDTALPSDQPRKMPPKRQPLANPAPLFSVDRMTGHIKFLASAELEGRGLGSEGLDRAATYIAGEFKKAGLQPGENNSYFQTWETHAGREKEKIKLRNVIGVLPGKKPEFDSQSVILCAHYDHLGTGWPDAHRGDEGKIHFGADDNASGVAVMLELARVLGKQLNPDRTIRFIAFTGEESGLLGSSYYIDNLKNRSPAQLKGIMAVVNLDTVGRLKDGGTLLVIGGSSAREWRFIFMGIGYTTGIETRLVTQELDASDQVGFLRAGIPGIQLFSGPHGDYHRPTDTTDRIEGAGLAKVAAVAREAIVYLAERDQPLTFQGPAPGIGAGRQTIPPSSGGRRVRTGIMPDFTFSGNGMKIGSIAAGSPAGKAGLRKDDIIIRVGDARISNLSDYSEALKTHQAGEAVVFFYLRDGRKHSASVVLETR